MSKYKPSLIAGHPAVDFVNTVGNRLTETPTEHFGDYESLLSWCEAARIVEPGRVKKLRALARQQSGQAEASLHRAIVMREQIYGLLKSYMLRKTLSENDLAVLNVFIRETAGHLSLGQEEQDYTLDVRGLHLDLPLQRVVWRLTDLLTSDRLKHLKLCDGPGCGWLFLDESRNRERKWCDSRDCGNRERVRRFYYKNKQRQK